MVKLNTSDEESKAEAVELRLAFADQALHEEAADMLSVFEGMAKSVRDRGAVPESVADSFIKRSAGIRRKLGRRT